MSSTQPYRWLAAALAASVAATLAACGASPAPARTTAARHHAPAPAARTARTYLTVVTSPMITRPGHGPGVLYIVRYPVSTVQLRSFDNGRVTGRTLLRSLGNVEAIMAPDGSVIAVADFGCRASVLRIDPATGRRTLIRTLPESASDVSLSPDGRRLAYLTYPAGQRRHECQAARQPARPVRTIMNPGGPVQFLPGTLAVVTLATGATVRTGTGSPGNPLGNPAWSPDGRRITAVYAGRDNPIVIMPSARPDFAAARWLRPPRHCGYVTATWVTAGLTAVLGCNRLDPGLSPRTLVRLSAAGRPVARWQLPACIDGIRVFADPAARQVLIQADTGYGNGPPCARLHHPGGWAIRIERVRGAELVPVATYPQNNATPLQLTGW